MHLVKGHLLKHHLVRWGIALLVVGAIGGVVWRLLARPGLVTLTPSGGVTTEAETLHQFGNVMIFIGIGATICFIWALALAFAAPQPGWTLVPFVTITAVVAAYLARAVGLLLSPDKVAVPKNADVGDTIPGILTMDAWSALIAWAVFGLGGLLLGTYLRAAREPSLRS